MDSMRRIPETAFITGAANGIGKALVSRFLAHGWEVIATDIDEQGLHDLKEDKNCRVFKMDVISDEDVQRVFDNIRETGQRIAIIINNAGIDRYFPLSEASISTIKEIFEINVFGAYRINQVFLPLLKKPGGKIIHIGSESAHLTVPFMPYPLTKNLLENYSKVLRQELRFLGIDVVLIKPGAINTQLLRNVSEIRFPVSNPVIDKIFKRFASIAPKEVGTAFEPDELARFIYKISLKSRVKAVYRVNNSLMIRLLGLLPYGLLEKMIYWRLKVKLEPQQRHTS